MNKTGFLLIVIASLFSEVSKAQINIKMIAKQIVIRDSQVEINYFEQGTGDTTLLFIHGWCIDATYWESQINYFSENYTVCAIDLPGFGQSKVERTNWTIEEYAIDVAAFIESKDLKNVVVVGHSMAGGIMLQNALTNNSRILGIVGVDNFKIIDVEFTPEQKQQMAAFFPMLKNDFKNTAPVYADMALFHPMTAVEVKNRVKADFAKSDSYIAYETCMNQMQYIAADAQRLEQLNYKLYLINCDSTPINEVGLQNHCRSGFHIETLIATGHYPMIEKPSEFNRVFDRILKMME